VLYRVFSLFRGTIHRNEPRFEELRRSLKMARIAVPYDIYLTIAILVGLLGGVLASAVLTTLLVMEGDVDAWLGGEVYAPALFLLLCAVLVPTTFYLVLVYPRLKARGRRSRIELTLPHAVTFMYAMSKSNMTVFEMFKLLAQHRDIYLEVSEEAEMIVRDVELFGSDLPTALKNASKHTPSKTFSDFCENIITVLDSGSGVSEFFATKSKQYLERAYQEQEFLLKTLEMLAETYVTAFVAGPIFLIVMLVTMGMLNMGYTSDVYYVLYLALPIASLGMLVLLEIIMPAGEVPTTSRPYEVRLSQFKYVPTSKDANIEERMRGLESIKKWSTLISTLRHPLKPFLDNHYRTLYITLPAAGILVLLWAAWWRDALTYETLVLYVLLVVLLPLSLFYEAKMFGIGRVEKAIPRFLRSLASLSEIGLSLRSAIEMLLHSNFGVLQGEIRKIYYDMEWGASSTYALIRFENRVRTLAVQRAVTLITKASEVSQNIQSVLLIAAMDAEHNLQLKRERYNNTFVYVVTIYISFAVFLYTSYTIGTSFIPTLTGVGQATAISGFDVSGSLSTMFHTSLILGFFSGLIAGKMSRGHVLYGIKHCILFVLISYLMFTRYVGAGA